MPKEFPTVTEFILKIKKSNEDYLIHFRHNRLTITLVLLDSGYCIEIPFYNEHQLHNNIKLVKLTGSRYKIIN